MGILVYASVAVLILVFLALAIIVLIWWKRRRYTRERFAFVSLTALLGISSLSIVTLAAPNPPWEIGLYLIANLFGIQYEPKEGGVTAFLFTLAVLALVYLTIRTLYLGWDGCISTRQSELEKRKQPTNISLDALIELRRILLRQGPQEIHSQDLQSRYEKVMAPTHHPLAWNHQVRDLLMLGSDSLYFDVNDDWHDKEDVWFGLNKKSGLRQAVFCTLDYPEDERLKRFVCYISKLCKNYDKDTEYPNGIELFVACKNKTPISITEVEGIKLKVVDEENLIANLIDFSNYFNKLDRRYKIDTLPESSLSLQDIYAPPYVSDLEKLKEPSKLETYLSQWLDEPGQRQIALLGEYGMGKSSLALSFAYKLSCTSEFDSKYIPILIELRGMSPRNLTPLQILAIWAQPYNINPNSLIKVIESGNALLIFDGFDEMELVGDPEQRLEHFRSLWGLCFPKSKMLITGRPNLFLDDQELKSALGIADPTGGGAYAEAVILLPFNIDQINSALRSVADDAKNGILELAHSDKKFLELISRPSLLYIVSQLWERSDFGSTFSVNSAVLMQRFIQYSLDRQTKKALDGEKFMILNSSERAHFMSGLAAYMFSKDLPNQIDRREMSGAIALIYKNLPEIVSTNVGAHKSEPNKPLVMRLKERENIVELIEDDVRSCGLITMDPTRAGSFRFSHKSFLEYLCAEVLALSGSIYQSIGALAIKRITELSYMKLEDSEEALGFYAELIVTDQSGKSVTNLKEQFNRLWREIFNSKTFFEKFLSWQAKLFLAHPLLASPTAALFSMIMILFTTISTPFLSLYLDLDKFNKGFFPIVTFIVFFIISSLFMLFLTIASPAGFVGRRAVQRIYFLISCTEAIGITPGPIRKFTKKIEEGKLKKHKKESENNSCDNSTQQK